MAQEQKRGEKKRRGRRHWRRVVRALHRDVGYLVVGLTLVYALSGLAVNHVADWDPSFVSYERVHDLGGPLEGTPAQVAATVAARLGVEATPRDVYQASPRRIDVAYDRRALHIDPMTGVVVDAGSEPRFFLRVANWLHLNRGKAGWTWIADTFALLLILLAVTGLLMIPGRRGLWGRGGLIAGVGVLIPIAYVLIVGGL